MNRPEPSASRFVQAEILLKSEEGEFLQTITESDALDRIVCLLEPIFGETNSSTERDENADASTETSHDGTEAVCIFTLTAADGSAVEFVLRGQVLRETETGREWRPDDELLAALKEALGLPA